MAPITELLVILFMGTGLYTWIWLMIRRNEKEEHWKRIMPK